jgi:hypothetical protein
MSYDARLVPKRKSLVRRQAPTDRERIERARLFVPGTAVKRKPMSRSKRRSSNRSPLKG